MCLLVPEAVMKRTKGDQTMNGKALPVIITLLLSIACGYGAEIVPREEKLIAVVKNPVEYDGLTQRRAVMELSARAHVSAASQEALTEYLFSRMQPANAVCVLWIAEAFAKAQNSPFKALISTYHSYQDEVSDMNTAFEWSKKRLGRMLRWTERFAEDEVGLVQEAYVKHFQTLFHNLPEESHLSKDAFTDVLGQAHEAFLKDLRNKGRFEPADILAILTMLGSVWEPIFAKLDEDYGGPRFEPGLENLLILLCHMGKKAEEAEGFLLKKLRENRGTDIEWSTRAALVNMGYKSPENRKLLLERIRNRSKNADGAVELLGKGCLAGFEGMEWVEAMTEYLGDPLESQPAKSSSAAIALSLLLKRTKPSTKAEGTLETYWNTHRNDSGQIIYGFCLGSVDFDERERVLKETLKYIGSKPAGIALNDTDWHAMDKATIVVDGGMIDELGGLLDSHDVNVVIGAMLMLSRCGLEAQKYAPKLIELLQYGTHQKMRSNPGKEGKEKDIAEIGNARGLLEALILAYGDKIERSLSETEPVLISALSILLAGPELRLRSAAALSLATMGRIEDMNALKQLLKTIKSNGSGGEIFFGLTLLKSICVIELRKMGEEDEEDMLPF